MSKRKALPCSQCHHAGMWSTFLLLLLLLLLTLAASDQEQQPCGPSSCGKISNISHPFRLQSDPEHCGDRSYELSCDNNVTVLRLHGGKYRVHAINYDNFTIRLVDAGIEEGDCSSIPRYFLYIAKFNKDTQPRFSERPTIEHVVYLNCSNPVKDDEQYVDTAPCVKSNGHHHGYVYAIVGDLVAGRLRDGCGVKVVAVIIDSIEIEHNRNSSSYADIHRVLAHGFELSWFDRAYEDRCGRMACYLHGTNHELQCLAWDRCRFFGSVIRECGLRSQLSELAQEYKAGVVGGLNGMFNPNKISVNGFYAITNDFRVGGIVTGRFIIPYMALRFLLGTIFLFVVLIYKWRKRHFSAYESIEIFLQGCNLMLRRYSYKEIKSMTMDFGNKLGQGAYGSVYKGKLCGGPSVAIKMLGKCKTNGQDFISEVATIGRIHHHNVVQLIGFCVEGSKRALVYEFMTNGSLDKYIFSKEGSVPLSYDKIYVISVGVAHGIAYLHRGCDVQILHFDIKPQNILLDETLTAKISDFGLAKLYSVDDSIVTLTAARGTIGYMAPELFYKNIGGVSHKSDVYSFGMLLMEMANRRKNLNPHAEQSSQLYFPLWIYDQFNEEKDIILEDVTEEEKGIVKKLIIVALWCIQLKPRDRPSMSKVVEMLEGEVEHLEMPPKPSLYPQETFVENDGINSLQTVSSDFASSSTSYPGEIEIVPALEKFVFTN